MPVASDARIPLLLICPLPTQYLSQIASRYEVIDASSDATRAAQISAHGARVRAVLTIGTLGLTATEIAALPALELVCSLGVGYETIDVAAARARGIVVATGAGTNDACVADHALGLLLAATRGLVGLDAAVRAGKRREDLPAYPPSISGRRMGIVGLGMIGKQIARRAAAFDMAVGYHNRKPAPDTSLPWFDSVDALARWSDVLVMATPGGAATRHMVNASVLQALGPEGVLINIGRGSVVDTAALAQALASGQIAAAGLDVYESEPLPPAELVGLPNVVLTPHVAGRSPQAMQASVDRFIANMDGHFAGTGAVCVV